MSAACAAHTVTASAGRPVAAHSSPQQSRALSSSSQSPVRVSSWSASRRCAAASWRRPASRSKITIIDSRPAWFHRSPASRDRARAAAQTGSAAARSPASISTHGQDVAAPPGYPSRGLPAVICPACRASRTARSRSPASMAATARLPRASTSPTGYAELPGHRQGTAGLVGRLGVPAHLGNAPDRPARPSASARARPPLARPRPAAR